VTDRADQADGTAQVVHRGVYWHRDRNGAISFYNTDSEEWVRWRRGMDAPPRPPGWERGTGYGRVARPKWTSPWRTIPMIGAVVIVAIAVWQVTRTSGGQEHKEAAATAGLLGKCLSQHGSLEGHPRYSTTPVDCGSPEAAVKVTRVLPTTPGSPLCPEGTTGFEIPYPGVQYPHVLCLETLHPPQSRP
jgi:hypothetical protein